MRSLEGQERSKGAKFILCCSIYSVGSLSLREDSQRNRLKMRCQKSRSCNESIMRMVTNCPTLSRGVWRNAKVRWPEKVPKAGSGRALLPNRLRNNPERDEQCVGGVC